MPMLADRLFQNIYDSILEGDLSVDDANTMIHAINSLDFQIQMPEIERTREVTIRGSIQFEYETTITVPMEPTAEEETDNEIVMIFEQAIDSDTFSIQDIKVIQARITDDER